MNKKSKSQSGVKLDPLSGQHFDMLPAERPKTQSRTREMMGFFLSGLLVFAVMMIFNAVTRGEQFVAENKQVALAGYENLKGGALYLKERDYEKASLLFEGAAEAFSDLEQSTRALTEQAPHLKKQNLYLDTADRLLDISVSVSRIAKELTSFLGESESLVKLFLQQTKAGAGEPLTDKIEAEKIKIDRIYAELKSIQDDLIDLNVKVLPEDLAGYVKVGQENIGLLVAALGDLDIFYDTFLELIGADMPHSYLVLLQNNHELRATGGFIGSYMLIDVNDGVITKMETQDIYATDGQLTDVVEAPAGIDRVADRLYMRDANYSPDFPTSAKDIMWFLEHSNGPTVDTVIAIDQTLVEKLLDLTGPVPVEGYPFIFTAENFNWVMSYFVEAKLSDTSSPKQLLFDFVPPFKEKLLTVKDFGAVHRILNELVQEKHIQVYSSAPQVQAMAQSFGLDGAMIAPQEKTDFLATVTTSIGGNKSDGFIETNILHRSDIAESGAVTNTVSIEKNHTWTEEKFNRWYKLVNRWGDGKVGLDTLKFILGSGPNKDYMRVYVPLGSELISAEGITLEGVVVSEDLGYTVFAFLHGPTQAGSSNTVSLNYTLPFTLEEGDRYKLLTQKQAGAENITFKKEFDLAEGLQVSEFYPKTSEAFSLTPSHSIDLTKNEFFVTEITKL